MAELHLPIPELGPGNQPPPVLVIEAVEGTVYLDLRLLPAGERAIPLDADQAQALAAALDHFAEQVQP